MNSQYRWIAALAAVVLLHGCGGGGGGAQSGGTGGTGVAIVSTGVMTKGSVILNGVRYEDTAANIVIDDTPKTAANLQSGMVVKVKGSVSNGGGGTAERVEAQVEVRGRVTTTNAAANPQSFVVLGQAVIVDDQTIYSNLANFAAIVANTTIVEVHGLRDATGRVRATRLEGGLTDPGSGIFMADPLVDEIRGVVVVAPGVNNPTAFTLGGQSILVNGSTSITPAGATYTNGSVVEVHCSRPCIVGSDFVATRLDVESAEDSAFQPGANERFEVEGLVSGFSTHPGNFSVAGVLVSTSNSTRFVGGISTDLGNDIKVEAEGVWSGSTLVASKIEFKRSVVRLQGVVTVSGVSTFTLSIEGRNVSIETDGFTSGGVPPVNPSNCIQVRGQRKVGGAVVITAVEIRNCSNSDRPVLQAPVEAEAGIVLTLLGFPIGVGNPTDTPPYQDLNGNPLTQTQFLAAVSAADPGPPPVAGTLVKVIFNTGLNTVRQVELED